MEGRGYGSAYDWNSGNIALWHSEATYCDPPSYLNRTYKGVLAGFIPVYAIYDKSHGKSIFSPFLLLTSSSRY